MNTKVKICGITNLEDLHLIAKAGADYGGVLIDIDVSPRNVTLHNAVKLFAARPVKMVAVSMNKTLEENQRIVEKLSPKVLQLHGRESAQDVTILQTHFPGEVWKVLHLPSMDSEESFKCEVFLQDIKCYADAGADRILLDTSAVVQGQRHYGGTGKTVNWELAKQICQQSPVPIVLAGGLNPDNAKTAINIVKPYAIDLSSGVEATKGKKDPEKVYDLFKNIR